MILEQETFEAFGYLSSDLKPKSHKPIKAVCDSCGGIRIISKSNYHALCRSCAHKGNTGSFGYTHTKEVKAKLSAAAKGNTYALGCKHTEEANTRKSARQTGTSRSDKTKALLSIIKRGANNPRWLGGISFEPYCIKFNKEYKNYIRNLFGNECFLCSKSAKDNGKALSVHHVNYNKNCGCDETRCICVPLCYRCHLKTNGDRNYWQALIMKMLEPFEAWK